MIRQLIAARKHRLRVEIKERLNEPATCKVWRHGVLVFDGIDRSALMRREKND